ncbi:hypothetical protein G4G28_21670 [Massilia sp. Dwa41.01b]|uniref:hypothetical protein n=1 Tax=unclassified Massilia TaxID=2609279 RepID=UPI001600C1AE|nr:MULTISPECIES: hypothetical protein [unclassified Massilia]QNA90454.1 hypothetical protein G4G28_21670 [Massilia sp. Dwa41.01b]QNA97685.1 hypothetical protein G4G31_00755 [Massilia sp. Se16.2.3]
MRRNAGGAGADQYLGPGIDPYALSRAIKSQAGAGRTAVVLLVGHTFSYDSALARGAGVRGLLDKPVADRNLVAVLQRLAALPAPGA